MGFIFDSISKLAFAVVYPDGIKNIDKVERIKPLTMINI